MNQKPKIIIIVGPTASGKTDLSIKLAKEFNGEIISADSRQVYKGMDLGTGKIKKEEAENIPHYMINIASPKKTFTVFQYVKKAQKAIKRILKRKKLPIIVGGTGFYIDALVFGLNIPTVPPNLKFRQKLQKKSTEELYEILKQKDPKRSATIDPKNKRRLIRSLEIIEKLGSVPPKKINPQYQTLFLGIKRQPEELKKRIKKRLISRIKEGMISEVKKLKNKGISWKKLENFGLEYKYAAQYLQNKISYQEMINKLNKAIWQYARRQLTWFKKNKNIFWIRNFFQAKKIINDFLKK
ncbi:MAG: tRNA (adenosine(37)-N6)-dimethylallyltransferase MiaA [Patescibacteria group bacterium]|nr:tRNA (adenosine(37)-N6)-dimethylallyltransferase MiaA [Patescibacteria group bacterium]